MEQKFTQAAAARLRDLAATFNAAPTEHIKVIRMTPEVTAQLANDLNGIASVLEGPPAEMEMEKAAA